MNISKLYNLFRKSSGICTDTRHVRKNNIFFALQGENFNGNDFAYNALEKGCSYSVIDDPLKQKNKNQILVSNVLKTLQELAKYHRSNLNCPVIGITGTNGKTTTKELIFTILNTQFKTIATEGNLNNHIGVPLTILSTPINTEMLIIEMGANHKDEINFLCNISQPTHGIITNIGKAHLEGFGSYEDIIKTKSELYQYIKHNKRLLFVNQNDKLLLSLSEGIPSEYYCDDHKLIESELLLTISYKGIRIDSKLIGEYNYQNIIAACSIGEYFDVSLNKCKDAIEHYIPSNNRSQIINTEKNNTILLDAYNANPSSMEAAISSFKLINNEKKKIIILGDMLELGKDSLSEHQKISDKLEKLKFSKTLLVGKEFQQTKSSFPVFKNIEELAQWIEKNPFSKSIILLKGSRGIKLEQLKNLL